MNSSAMQIGASSRLRSVLAVWSGHKFGRTCRSADQTSRKIVQFVTLVQCCKVAMQLHTMWLLILAILYAKRSSYMHAELLVSVQFEFI